MQIEVKATKRELQGSGASRRLRRAGRVPGIVYGGETQPAVIELDHNDLYHALQKEAFHASVLTLDLDGARESVVLRDVQWHGYRPLVLHIDFQRVDATHKIHVKVPLHFVNADIAPGVKLSGGNVNHVMTEVDVTCLPANLPEFLEVDLKDLGTGESIHLTQIKYPEGVEPVQHKGEDPVVVAISVPRGGAAEGGEEAAAE
ncbi:MAG: 50S ribosomal protein L25/general stress protein Ctc [Rhodocyclaceae bacterium]|nr:50S ribosomal protein L25/general stress protein Ctc [Rhodocyclaceae bacterium]